MRPAKEEYAAGKRRDKSLFVLKKPCSLCYNKLGFIFGVYKNPFGSAK